MERSPDAKSMQLQSQDLTKDSTRHVIVPASYQQWKLSYKSYAFSANLMVLLFLATLEGISVRQDRKPSLTMDLLPSTPASLPRIIPVTPASFASE